MAAALTSHAAEPLTDSRLHEIAEATDTLRCSRQTIYRLARDGDLRLIKIRAKTLVVGLDQLIARQLAASSAAGLADSGGV